MKMWKKEQILVSLTTYHKTGDLEHITDIARIICYTRTEAIIYEWWLDIKEKSRAATRLIKEYDMGIITWIKTTLNIMLTDKE